MRATRAIDEGRCRGEIVPVPVKDEQGNPRLFDTDEHPRRNTSLEKLAALQPPVPPGGRPTAGESPRLHGGAPPQGPRAAPPARASSRRSSTRWNGRTSGTGSARCASGSARGSRRSSSGPPEAIVSLAAPPIGPRAALGD